MGWAERANPNSEYNKKRYGEPPPLVSDLGEPIPEPKLTLWKKIKHKLSSGQ
jgi:hypothetical protein